MTEHAPLRPLPPRQAEALFFIRDYRRVHAQSPSEGDIARHLGISPPAVHELVLRLEDSARIVRERGLARSIRIPDEAAELEREAKGIVLHAFRNGPLESIHSGRPCPECSGKNGYSRITDEEMKGLMKTAVNRVFTLLKLREEDPGEYERLLQLASLSTKRWDPPEWSSEL